MQTETEHKISIMQAWKDGKKIQSRARNSASAPWERAGSRRAHGRVEPVWNWAHYEYRVEPDAPKEIFVNEYTNGSRTTHNDVSDAISFASVTPASVNRIAVRYREVQR